MRVRRLSGPCLCDHASMAEFCCITYPDGMGHTTMAASVFDAAVKALHWSEVECATFGTARRFRDDQTLVIGVGMVPDRHYRVRIGRVREWDQRRRDAA